jgi:hypothetical protein
MLELTNQRARKLSPINFYLFLSSEMDVAAFSCILTEAGENLKTWKSIDTISNKSFY